MKTMTAGNHLRHVIVGGVLFKPKHYGKGDEFKYFENVLFYTTQSFILKQLFLHYVVIYIKAAIYERMIIKKISFPESFLGICPERT